MIHRDVPAPLAGAALGALGIVVGVFAWWVVLYAAAFAISMLTQDVVWGRWAIRAAQIAAVLAGVVGASRVRSMRPFLLGAVVGFVAFGLWAWSK